jgi:hypothetical protein
VPDGEHQLAYAQRFRVACAGGLKAASRDLQESQVGGGMAADHLCRHGPAIPKHLDGTVSLADHVVVGDDAAVAIPDDAGANTAAVYPDLDYAGLRAI